jgi:hypothetical protein
LIITKCPLRTSTLSSVSANTNILVFDKDKAEKAEKAE